VTRHHYPTDDAWSAEREEQKAQRQWDIPTGPRHGETEERPTRAELGDDR
jgi:hypothetical protein